MEGGEDEGERYRKGGMKKGRTKTAMETTMITIRM